MNAVLMRREQLARVFEASGCVRVQAADVAVARGVTAIIGYNDIVAFGIVSRLNARRIAVPEAMSVVGFDDIPAAAIWSPSLTTVASSTTSIGKTAVRDLLQLANGKPLATTQPWQLASHLVIRNSTGPVPLQQA